MVGVPPSASVAVASQVSVSPTLAIGGVTVTVVKEGSRFETVTLASAVSLNPLSSVAVAVQRTASPGRVPSVSVMDGPVAPVDQL